MTTAMYGTPNRAGRYLSDSLATASPSVLLVMLYDRLILDLTRGEQALVAADRESAHNNLVHAQEIVRELLSSLELDQWDGAPALGALYTWLLKELMAANLAGDAERIATCRVETVEPLAEAWRQAALEHAAMVTPTNGVA